MAPTQYVPINLTRAQAHALAKVGRELGPQVHNLFPDGRHRSAIERAFDLIDDHLDGAVQDSFDVDLEHLGDQVADLKSHEMSTVIRTRVRDLLAVLVLWRALEELSGVEDIGGLMGVPQIDDVEWRAEVLDLLIDRGVTVELPGEHVAGHK